MTLRISSFSQLRPSQRNPRSPLSRSPRVQNDIDCDEDRLKNLQGIRRERRKGGCGPGKKADQT